MTSHDLFLCQVRVTIAELFTSGTGAALHRQLQPAAECILACAIRCAALLQLPLRASHARHSAHLDA